MAPEQWRGAPCAFSDVYSLGCVMLYAVRGHVAWAGEPDTFDNSATSAQWVRRQVLGGRLPILPHVLDPGPVSDAGSAVAELHPRVRAVRAAGSPWSGSADSTVESSSSLPTTLSPPLLDAHAEPGIHADAAVAAEAGAAVAVDRGAAVVTAATMAAGATSSSPVHSEAHGTAGAPASALPQDQASRVMGPTPPRGLVSLIHSCVTLHPGVRPAASSVQRTLQQLAAALTR